MYIVQILLLPVLILQICNAFPYANDLIINFLGNSNQMKINSKNGVPRGYVLFENSFYKYHRDPQTWAKARQICEVEGGYLAIVNSEEEANFLRGMMSKYPDDVLTDVVHKSCVFLGFHDYFKEGEFVTIDGKSLESSGYMHWAAGQPDNAGGKENCGALLRNGRLFDLPCGDKIPFICEISTDTLCTMTAVETNNQSNPDQSQTVPVFDVRSSARDD
ncbi:hemolymph lipopolysaccharide-binding protein-like [Chrysoperla carnea]|uniref:hemolymph lipopolysaccharide-binding protein-like n=1 Tax=Chrysoperla carnea TaxID=189513 RepID=UPI001D08CFB3|nr:hemolymph lipopolysaccharide-binding protein-like [Chrysoperla carnea]